eukprot:CAMPEP_0204184414 /NCGR_PEP_ID=MMETSP0361-20130328/54423_1 /ASSEMBLY_ACC=CAM_ASM_000343 /TAXON_ID=268821 /ORGANISM="Scrippsiella Hangoei, Strain SHTV-5" /LENGTH=697 /DNA_ID=CAMNT_0051144441 /DNA_START=170 /DNA_END=2260 /DNA_ORIENTATION=-
MDFAFWATDVDDEYGEVGAAADGSEGGGVGSRDLLSALRAMDAEELGNLAKLRSFLSKKRGVPKTPLLAQAFAAELGARKRLPLLQATRLAEAAASLGGVAAVAAQMPSLCHRIAQRKSHREAMSVLITLVQMSDDLGASRVGPTEAEILSVFKAFFIGNHCNNPAEGPNPPAVAAALECADRLGCGLPPVMLKAAASALCTGLSGGDKPKSRKGLAGLVGGGRPTPRFGEAMARSAARGADLAEVNRVVASKLIENALRGESGRQALDEWLWQLRCTWDGIQRAAIDCGLEELLVERLQREWCNFDDALLVGFARLVQDTRSHRPGVWKSILGEMQRRLPTLSTEHFAHCVDLARKSTFRPSDPAFFQEFARHVGPILSQASPEDLARLLHTFCLTLPEPLFMSSLVVPHAEAIRARMAQPETLGTHLHGVLQALANGGGKGAGEVRPSWWRSLVLRPWAREMRTLTQLLRSGPSGLGGRAAYVGSMEAYIIGDVGRVWSQPLMAALQFAHRHPPPAFLRRALRCTLRQRRAMLASDMAAGRALGFVAWHLGQRTGQHIEEEGVLTENVGLPLASVARLMDEEEDSSLLLTARVGFLEKAYRRHGDVERVALLAVLKGLRAHETGRSLLRRGGEGMACITGVVDIYVDRITCLSCLGVLAQFKKAFPGVEVRVACAFPPWLPRKLPYERYYGVVNR